jgi:hypothetical protein
MTRDGMPRAYLRIDPNIDQTVGDLEGFVRLLCSAARQPERGRFRDRAILDRSVGRVRVGRMIERGDVSVLEDGRLYVQGWDEWQEGDLTVGERMKRMRARRKSAKTVSHVTPPPSPARNDVTTDAVAKGLEGVSEASAAEISPPPDKPGRRKDGTNPRALGTNPRANGTSERQIREDRKKGGLDSIHAILEAARKGVPA